MEVGGVDGEAALAALIADLDHQEVVDLLRRAAMEHEDVARSVRLAASSDADRLQLLRAAVDQGLRTRRFLDYWASSRWAGDAAPVVDALRAEASQRQSRELVVLVERAVGHVVKVILQCRRLQRADRIARPGSARRARRGV